MGRFKDGTNAEKRKSGDMTRGHRRPTPTKLKLLRGNPGRRPLPENEPQIPAGIPEMPKHLNRIAKQEWRRIMPELARVGLLTRIDGTALAAYCDCYAQWAEACRKLRKTGMLVRGTKGDPIINPLLKIANQAVDRMRMYLIEFGMTPASRSKTKAAPKPEERGDAEAYFDWVSAREN